MTHDKEVDTEWKECCDKCHTRPPRGYGYSYDVCNNTSCSCHTTPAHEWREEFEKTHPRATLLDGFIYYRQEDVNNFLDTHTAHLVERIEKLKENRRRCRACGKHTLEKSKGLGKVAFEFQCSECGNYQEETSVHNQALDQAIDIVKDKK